MIFKPKCTKYASIGSVTNLCGPVAERFKLRKKLGTKSAPRTQTGILGAF